MKIDFNNLPEIITCEPTLDSLVEMAKSGNKFAIRTIKLMIELSK